MKKISGFIILVCLSLSIQAQDTLSVRTVAQSFGDSIIVRWAPLDWKVWQLGIQNGYVLKRTTISINDKYLSPQQKFATTQTIVSDFKPLPQKDWEALVKKDDMAGVAAGAIYSPKFEVEDWARDSLMQAYNTTMENENRHGFSLFAADQSLLVAQAMGLAYVDKDIVSGGRYLYTINILEVPPRYVVEEAYTLVAVNDQPRLPIPEDLKGEFSNKKVMLSWSRHLLDQSYISFDIEKSADNIQFEKVNKLPFVNMDPPGVESKQIFFGDSLAQNSKTYYYRVRGKTPFGTYGPSSKVISGQGKPDPIPIYPNITDVSEIQEGTMTLEWVFDASFNDKISGFDVYRAKKKTGQYLKLNTTAIEAASRTYTDTNPWISNYYMVKALDKNGYELPSFSVLGQPRDTVPPSQPLGVIGECDKHGVVTLRWSPNKEEDLKGYRVFVANQEDNPEYSQITAHLHRDTVYTDTIVLKILSEQIFYKIRAMDFRGNGSAYSEACKVIKVDIVPPSPPTFKKKKSSKKGVFLSWSPSSSKDLARHELQRKKTYEIQWETLVSFDTSSTLGEFFDTTASYKHIYHYRLLAIDDADLMSSSAILEAKPTDTGIRPPIENFTAIPNQEEKAMTINWTYELSSHLQDFMLYKAKNDDPLRIYKTWSPKDVLFSEINGDKKLFQFLDKRVSPNTTYRYQLIARFKSGASSPLSELLELEN